MTLATFARQIGLESRSPPQLDYMPNHADHLCAAAAFRVTAEEIEAMVHRQPEVAAVSLLATHVPMQFCFACRSFHKGRTKQAVEIKAWFEYWSFECTRCQRPFCSLTPPRLTYPNPAQEDPVWYENILYLARRGARDLQRYSSRPHQFFISPIAVLELLSARFGVFPYDRFGKTRPWPQSSPARNHCLAELLIPGLREKLNDAPLIPLAWHRQRPVRDVTARTLLLAALAAFQANIAGSWARILVGVSKNQRQNLQDWRRRLPERAAQCLSS